MKSWVGSCLLLLLASGCVSPTGQMGFGARMPAAADLGGAARTAFLAPATWAPLALAATTQISDWDDDATQWAARERPLFGKDASDVSDTLKAITTGTYFASALLVPSASWQDRARGLGVGVTTMLVEGALSEGLKGAVGRERPNGRGDKSFPSGHASQAASRAALTRANLRHAQLAPWQRHTLNAGLHTLAAGTAWARVEANKHHLSDVLVGMAMGNFLGRFAQEAFLPDAGAGQVQVMLLEGGGVLTLSLPVGAATR